jgi:ATP-dependent DNA helicase RecG
MLDKKENQDVEFKESWRDEYIKWICGFANAKGGQIYIGVDDSGYVVGIENAKKLLEDIPNKVRDILGVIVDLNMQVENDKEYLEIVIEPYPYPVSYKGQYHYRTGSSKQELKGASLDKFLFAKQGKKWDGVPVPYVSVEDLDSRAIEIFKEKAIKKKRVEADILDENDEIIIDKLHLKDGDYLKRAAILLFAKDCEKYITGSYVKIGYFKTDSELIYQDRIDGNILEQVDKTMDLIFTKYLKAYISYDGIQRVESFPISQLAFREALTNAIVHKDYGELTPVQISIYDNKLLIWNVGELPKDWTVETLTQKHSSKPYNPAIANVFFFAGLIESWGRGIDKIINESEKFNGITPKFRFDNGLWVEFDFNELMDDVPKERA